ncbi:MAG: hypothetical protein ACKOX6_05070 [Bdellovibrio sp.]
MSGVLSEGCDDTKNLKEHLEPSHIALADTNLEPSADTDLDDNIEILTALVCKTCKTQLPPWKK